jgi:prepilin-type N-terminal cleavage/methylation domain-containing protein
MQTNHKFISKTRQAFGLVEILVVLAVIAVIAVIAYPGLTGSREAQDPAAAVTLAEGPVADLVARATDAGAVDSSGNAPTIEGISAGTVYTTPDGVVFSMESVQAEQ